MHPLNPVLLQVHALVKLPFLYGEAAMFGAYVFSLIPSFCGSFSVYSVIITFSIVDAIDCGLLLHGTGSL